MTAPLVAWLLCAATLLVGTPPPDDTAAWFGPTVPDAGHLAVATARLGEPPSLVGVEVGLPLDDDDRAALADVAGVAAGSGTVVVVDAGSDDDVPTPAAAAGLAHAVRALERDRGVQFLVRHSGSDAGGFRTLAAAVHADTDAATVWDDTAGSTWPGDEAVDWVATTLPGAVEARGRPVLVEARPVELPVALALVGSDDRVRGVLVSGDLPRGVRRGVLGSERLSLAPVYTTTDRDASLVTPQPAGPAPGADATLDSRASSSAWWWLGSGGLLVLAVVAALLRPGWLDVDDLRDPRADVVRGTLLLGSAAALVATLGLDLGSMPGWLVVATTGTLLALSGCVHRLSEWPVDEARTNPLLVPRHLRRAGLVLLAALALSGLHVVLGRVLDSPFSTTAPGPVALLGLVACLAAAATALGHQCRRGRGWLLLTGSWALLALGVRTGWQVPGLPWEAGWPLLVWQLPFVHGFVVTDLLLAHPGRGRRWALAGLGVAGLSALGWGALLLVGLVPAAQPAVVVALLGATTVAAVACCLWGPVARLLGWTGVVGRHPYLATATLVAAVVAVAQV